MKPKLLLLIFAVLLALYGGVFLLTSDKSKKEEKKTGKKEKIVKEVKKINYKTVKKPIIISKEQLKKALEDTDEFISVSIDSLRKKFGKSISDIREQIKLIRFRDFVKKSYPEKWKTVFKSIILKAFPDDAKSIFNIIERMDQYNEWLATSENFRGMSYGEIKKTLSSIRLGFFGNDANIIWGEESKIETIRDTIAILDRSSDSLNDKLLIFKDTIDNEYTDDRKMLVSRKYNLATAFFNMGSVQSELQNMGDKERYQTLASIRKKIGYSDKEVEIMEKRDRKRDIRWQNGLMYMKERSLLEKNYSGDELSGKITALQKKHFGYEAKTISTEEKSGFFRYNRKRIFGRN